jgi:hypothetical protein
MASSKAARKAAQRAAEAKAAAKTTAARAVASTASKPALSLRPNAQDAKKLTHHSRALFWVWLILVAIMALLAVTLGANRPNFWLWWEAGALIIATLYTMVFYVRFFVSEDEEGNKIYKGIADFIGLVPIFCAGAVVCLVCSTVASLFESLELDWFAQFLARLSWLPNTFMLPLVFLVPATLCFCLVDLTFARKHSNGKIKQEFGRALYFNGLPVFVAFLILLVFVSRFDNRAEWSHVLRSFVGGAVAFETVVSNTMFAILFFEPKV